MSASNETPAQKLIGDFAPKMVSLTDDVLFGDVWERAELARQNGLTETELKEVIIHLAFYAGWPRAMSAIAVAKQAFNS
jgi:4-carboxymuconolactone decarboxylase